MTIQNSYINWNLNNCCCYRQQRSALAVHVSIYWYRRSLFVLNFLNVKQISLPCYPLLLNTHKDPLSGPHTLETWVVLARPPKQLSILSFSLDLSQAHTSGSHRTVRFTLPLSALLVQTCTDRSSGGLGILAEGVRGWVNTVSHDNSPCSS